MARNYNQHRTCKVYNKKHPISLHRFKLKTKTKLYELSMIHLIKVTRHKMEFGKTMLEYVTKILFAHPLRKRLSDQYLCGACRN